MSLQVLLLVTAATAVSVLAFTEAWVKWKWVAFDETQEVLIEGCAAWSFVCGTPLCRT